MTLSYFFVIVAFILAIVAMIPPVAARLNWLAAAFASYMLSILIGAWPGG